jgi:hypothetical protein
MRTAPLLFALGGGGAAWMLHLLAGYFLVSVGCARGWPAIGTMLALVTAACALAALAVTTLAWRGRRRTGRAGEDQEAARVLFGVGAVLGLVFAIMIGLGGLTVVALPPCGRS